MRESGVRLLNHREPAIAQAIRQVLFEAYTVEAALLGVEDFPPLRRTLSSVFKSDNDFAGVFRSDRLAGVIETPPQPDGSAPLSISSLGVDPAFARQGIGTMMLVHAFSRGHPRVLVSTGALNHPAIKMYEKLGFELIDQHTNRHGIPVVHFERHQTSR